MARQNNHSGSDAARSASACTRPTRVQLLKRCLQGARRPPPWENGHSRGSWRSTPLTLTPGRIIVRSPMPRWSAPVCIASRASVFLLRCQEAGGWRPPTGAVKPGERLTQATRRTVAEEIGIGLKITGALGIYSDPDEQLVTDRKGRLVHLITTVFVCEPVLGPIVLASGRGSEAGWFPRDSPPRGMVCYARWWLRDFTEYPASIVLR